MNISAVLLLFASILEPFIWLAAFDRCLCRKYPNKLTYLLYILGDWMIALVREGVVARIPGLNVLFTVALILYVFLYVNLTYRNALPKKLLVIGILFILSLCSDIIIMGLLLLFGESVSVISESGFLNSLAALLSKCLFYVFTLIAFRNQRKLSEDTDEIVPIIFGTILCELPSVVLFNQINLLSNNGYMLFIFVFGQIILLALIIYVLITLNERKKMELQLRTRLHDIEIEMSSNQSWEESMRDVRHFRHDIKMHLSLLMGLLQEAKYDNAEQYLKDISEEVNEVEDFYALKNRNVAILLSQKKRYADKRGVRFLPEIMLEDYIISDKDICSILSNVLDNAVEAACQCNNGFVNIIMKADPDSHGYFIVCENNYKEVDLKRGKYITTKNDRDNHGLGIDIINRLVKGYHGKCSFNNDNKSKNFIVEIYIPGSE